MKLNHNHSLLSLFLVLTNFINVTLGLLVTQTTTLYGDQYFDEDIIVTSGATLTIENASRIVFNGAMNIAGTFNIIGHPTWGINYLDFRRCHRFINRGHVWFRNLAPPGDASDFVIDPQYFYNYGSVHFTTVSTSKTVLTSHASYQPKNFTLAPTENFYNSGTLDFDSDLNAPNGNGFLYLGSSKSASFNNVGTVKVAGKSDFNSKAIYVADLARGIEFNGPTIGSGRIYNRNAFIGINHNSIVGQNFLLNDGLFYVRESYTESEYSYASYDGGNTFVGVVGMQTYENNVFQRTADPYMVSYVNTRGVPIRFKNICTPVSNVETYSLDYTHASGSVYKRDISVGSYVKVPGTSCSV